MAELLFKRGKQSALDTIIKNKTGIEGCFYLTEDTNRLYVGQSNGQAPVLLNQVVSVVETEKDLPVAPPAVDNDFYYIKSLNVLAVYDSTKKDATHSGWVQINANTNDTIRVTEASFDDGVKSGTADSITYTLTLKQTQKDINNKETALDDITAELVLNSELISGIVPEAAEVGLTASVNSNNELVIATEGAGANGDNVAKVTPGSNINIVAQNDQILLSATDTLYGRSIVVDTNGVKSRLTGSNGSEEDIIYKAGEGLDVSGDATAKSITYTHKTYNGTSTAVENGSDNDGKLVAGSKLNIISGIDVSNGHISNISTSELTLPADTIINGISKTENKDWSRTLTESNGGTHEIDFSGEAAALEANLKAEISNKLAAANSAMTYKGTVSSVEALSVKTDVEIGDVWLFSENDGEYKTGDMAIAISSDGSVLTGVIPADKVKWERIPSGDELNTDTLFKGTVAFDSTDGNGSVTYGIEPVSQVGTTTVDGNKDITLQAGVDLTISNNEGKALINHKAFTAKATTGTAVEQASAITAVTGVTTSNGHVTEVVTTTYTPVTYDIEGKDNKITMTTNAGGTKSIGVAGDGKWISATVANNALAIAHNDPQAATSTVTAKNGSDNDGKLVASGPLNILSEVKYDDKGHVVGASTATLTLPADTTYQVKVTSDAAGTTVANATANPYLLLAGTNGGVSYTQIQGSNNLSVVGNDKNIAISMVWGSF